MRTLGSDAEFKSVVENAARPVVVQYTAPVRRFPRGSACGPGIVNPTTFAAPRAVV